MKKFTTILNLLVITTLLCQAQNPVLLGMANSGGTNNVGTIFSYNISTFKDTDLHNFNSSIDGAGPEASLIKASNGLLYGMTYGGGDYGKGIIFSYNDSTGTETVLHNFGNGTDGQFPNGSLIQASNNLIYGETSHGGTDSDGTIFSYNISTGIEIDLHDFGSDTDGRFPNGSLIQASDSLLYGMTTNGGADSVLRVGAGTIFSYNIVTGAETVLHNFKGYPMDGAQPIGSLNQASNGLLYGMTLTGGKNYYDGIIFSYNISTAKETDIHDFGDDSDGNQPSGSLFQITDSLLYGMTWGGGIKDSGTIFNYNIFSGVENVIHDFGIGMDGYYPQGSLIQASNSLIYGMTPYGGANDSGIIFSYNVFTGTLIDIHDFGNIGGSYPYGDLIEIDTPTTGINRLSINDNNFSIYPNPTSGQFTVKLDNNQSGYEIDVYNVLGEKIYQSILSNYQNNINLSNQPSGMYFVNLKSEEDVEVGKVLVTK